MKELKKLTLETIRPDGTKSTEWLLSVGECLNAAIDRINAQQETIDQLKRHEHDVQDWGLSGGPVGPISVADEKEIWGAIE